MPRGRTAIERRWCAGAAQALAADPDHDDRPVLARTQVNMPDGTVQWAEMRVGQTAWDAAAAFLVGFGAALGHADDPVTGQENHQALADGLQKEAETVGPVSSGAAWLYCADPMSALPETFVASAGRDKSAQRWPAKGCLRDGVSRIRLAPGTQIFLHERDGWWKGRTWERRCPPCTTGCDYLLWADDDWTGGVGSYSLEALTSCPLDAQADDAVEVASLGSFSDQTQLGAVVASVSIVLSSGLGTRVIPAYEGDSAEQAVERFLDSFVLTHRWSGDWRGGLEMKFDEITERLRDAAHATGATLADPEGGATMTTTMDPARSALAISVDDRAAYYASADLSTDSSATAFPPSWYVGRPSSRYEWGLWMLEEESSDMYSWAEPEVSGAATNDQLDAVFAEPLRALLNASGISASVPFVHGDLSIEPDAPVVCKSRPVGSRRCALIKSMQASRHWGPVAAVPRIDTPFEKKTPTAVWRGTATGRWTPDGIGGCSRQQLYLRWGLDESDPVIDVGLTGKISDLDAALVAAGAAGPRRFDAVFKRDMPRDAMLRHRYQVSVAGYDVASNLKWVLASWSVPLMPRPRVETWCMEGLLEPYVHYVPLLDDTSDLAAQVAWCEAQGDKCRDVAAAGRRWMDMFADPTADRGLEVRVMREFVARHARALAGRATFVAMAEGAISRGGKCDAAGALEEAERLLEGTLEGNMNSLWHLRETLAARLEREGGCSTARAGGKSASARRPLVPPMMETETEAPLMVVTTLQL